MAPFMALGANALAATILCLAIGYGDKFGRTVHVDGSAGLIAQTQCLFIGKCRTIDIDHCFWSSQIMILVLALGGILVADFTLWAYSLHKKYMDELAPVSYRKGLFARIFVVRPTQRFEEDAEDRDSNSGKRSHESSSLVTTALGALCCVSALALFAPHKVNFISSNAIKTFSAEDYISLQPVVSTTEIEKGLSDLLIDSASVTKDAAVAWLGSKSEEPWVREPRKNQTEVPRSHRIGDTTYQSIRTDGIGANLASFQEYFLTGRDKSRVLQAHGYQTSLLQQTWISAPDYQFGSLEASVYGTDMNVVCEDVTSQFDIQVAFGKIEPTYTKAGWKPYTKQVVEHVISDPKRSISVRVFHEISEVFKVTPYSRSWSPEQFIILTDSSKNADQDTTVVACTYSGNDFMTRIVMRPDSIKTPGRRDWRNHSKLRPAHINLVHEAIANVLGDAIGPLHKALNEVRTATAIHAKGIRDSEVMKSMIQDLLTDLASGYWSLMRQQIETSLGVPYHLLDGREQRQFKQLGVEKLGVRSGQLHGSYTRLGGSLWGLIMPLLLLLLPIYSIWRLFLALMTDKIIAWCAREESGPRYSLPLLQSDLLLQGDEEEVVDYYDVPPPMPPPKDHEEEPPPPYTSHNGEMSA